MGFRKAQGELVEISIVQKAAFQVARILKESLLSKDTWQIERYLTAALRQRLSEAA